MSPPGGSSGRHARGPIRVTHHIGGTLAGSTQVVLNLLRLHERDRIEPSVCFSSIVTPDPALVEETQRLGVRWRAVTKRTRYDALTPVRLAAAFRSLGTEIAVLHGFGGYTFGATGSLLARVPVRVRVEHSPELHTAAHRLAARLCGPIAHSTILVSRYLLEYLDSQGIGPPAPEVIYNGVELQRFVAVARTPFEGGGVPVVLMAARLDPPKDQATLLAAVARLTSRGVTVRLQLAGVGGEAESLRQQATALGVADRVELLGFRSDLTALLEQADIGALITRYEGFGLAAVEAMAAARPVVLTRVASLPELVDEGREGHFAEVASVESTADALARLIANPEQARAMGAAGRQRALRQFALLPSVRAIEAHIFRIAAARGLRSP